MPKRFRNFRLGLVIAVGAGVACAVAAVRLWPHAIEAAELIAAQDDAAAIADRSVRDLLRGDGGRLVLEASTALANDDPELAQSFADLASESGLPFDDALTSRIAQAAHARNSSLNVARRFALGLATGQADDAAGLSGAVAGDLFVFGDLRDLAREGKHLVMGEETDRLLLGLAGLTPRPVVWRRCARASRS
jgi:hypothetical protein